MERGEALEKLALIHRRDLVELATELQIPIYGESGKKNKGWAGHVFERYLGLPLNSSRAPNFGSWELKSASLQVNRKGILQVKETVAITMMDPVEVMSKDFEESHLYTKLKKQIVVVRVWENREESRSYYLGAYPVDIENHALFSELKADYDAIKKQLQTKGSVSSSIGTYIQSRTKGAGHGSTSRAFYAKKNLVAQLINLDLLNQEYQELIKI